MAVAKESIWLLRKTSGCYGKGLVTKVDHCPWQPLTYQWIEPGYTNYIHGNEVSFAISSSCIWGEYKFSLLLGYHSNHSKLCINYETCLISYMIFNSLHHIWGTIAKWNCLILEIYISAPKPWLSILALPVSMVTIATGIILCLCNHINSNELISSISDIYLSLFRQVSCLPISEFIVFVYVLVT